MQFVYNYSIVVCKVHIHVAIQLQTASVSNSLQFSCFCCRLLTFFQNQLFLKKIFQEHYQSVNGLDPDQGRVKLYTCADPESFAGGGPTFFFLIQGKRIQIALKAGRHRPFSETPFK